MPLDDALQTLRPIALMIIEFPQGVLRAYEPILKHAVKSDGSGSRAKSQNPRAEHRNVIEMDDVVLLADHGISNLLASAERKATLVRSHRCEGQRITSQWVDVNVAMRRQRGSRRMAG